VYGRDRGEAIDKLRRALQEYEIAVIKTTLPFFREVMEDDVFISGSLDTSFISQFAQRRKVRESETTNADIAIVAAALAHSSQTSATGGSPAGRSPEPSRWVAAGRAALHQR
jgi:acetyl/propionyl-CoA carboxylase alpha subunit